MSSTTNIISQPPQPNTENHKSTAKNSDNESDNNCDNSDNNNCVKVATPTIKNNDEDIVGKIIDPGSRRSFIINKSAYVKLHRNSSSCDNNRNYSVNKLKIKYETGDESNTKKSELVIPSPKPRHSLTTDNNINAVEINNKVTTDVNDKKKDENANLFNKGSDDHFIVLRQSSGESIEKIGEELSNFIIMDKKPTKDHKRSNSFKKMFSKSFFGNNKDKKKKEEAKKVNQPGENVNYTTDNMENETSAFNHRHQSAGQRHSMGNVQSNYINNQNSVIDDDFSDKTARISDNSNELLEKKYAEMHINRFNQIRHNFSNEIGINRVDDNSSQSKKKPSITDFISVPVKKYIDTSSSTTSTSELDKMNLYENTTIESPRILLDVRKNCDKTDGNTSKPNENGTNIISSSNAERKHRFYNNYSDNFRQTPPRAQETYQDYKLIKPKALIPINSERSLPNPYQNNSPNSNNSLASDKELKLHPRTIERNLNTNDKAYPVDKSNLSTTNNNNNSYLSDTYGTVFDCLEYSRANRHESKPVTRSPNSPVPKVESSKLKLPPNREIYNLQPRVKSPIPSDKISTEKIIATELLRNSTRSPTPPRKVTTKSKNTTQNLSEFDSSTPIKYVDSAVIKTKPPISPKILLSSSELQRNQKETATIPDRIIYTNALVHTNQTLSSPSQYEDTKSQQRAESPMIRPQQLSVANGRSSTPVDVRLSPSLKLSPQKEDIRKSVEAYYWKELKKMKEQEDYELYMMQVSSNHGYLDADAARVRRSRSLSPSVQRNGRRSLSLPREGGNKSMQQYGGGRMNIPPQPPIIPEDRAIVYINNNNPLITARRHLNYENRQMQQSNFTRNTPERQTISSFGGDGTYANDSMQRPIFKRGSLNKQDHNNDGIYNGNKKVSFSSTRHQSLKQWPTKNGYTQSPPQRRPSEKGENDDDEVFLPNNAPSRVVHQLGATDQIYGYAVRQQGATTVEPIYVMKSNQNNNLEPQQQTNLLYYHHPRIPARYGQQLQQQQQREVVSLRARNPSHESLNMYPVNRGQMLEQQQHYVVDPRRSSNGSQPIKRQIIITDDIYGEFGGYQQNRTNSQLSLVRSTDDNNSPYLMIQPDGNNHHQNPIYTSRQSVADSVISGGANNNINNNRQQKQISINNKVCDIYGQIHDHQSGEVQQSGVLYGQLQRSPLTNRQNYANNQSQNHNQKQQQQQQFLRGTRLTASANDMGTGKNRRYYNPANMNNDLNHVRQNFDEYTAPTRPLPPLPNKKKPLPIRYLQISDPESGSDVTGEIQRIMHANGGGKVKKQGFFGK